MPSFEKQFKNSHGKPIEYKGLTIYLSDRIPVKNKDSFRFWVEKAKKEWRQGISLNITKGVLVSNFQESKSFHFWSDTAPKEFSVSVKISGDGDAELIVYNIWDTGDKAVHVGHNGAGIIIEEIPSGKRYRCNDGHPDEDFDDLIFKVEKL